MLQASSAHSSDAFWGGPRVADDQHDVAEAAKVDISHSILPSELDATT
ncbi:hypothetical protein RISK_005389 [Rhodopirellula islandica]|uniref:Uncharacterized protein n=1 Tax=Rhodopirellula islandica TaxID=595434 RepID=A0A0J1B6V4_RHOIS|nr:hypothetical protein RISK_005389 [Rhodopirellula islandica]